MWKVPPKTPYGFFSYFETLTTEIHTCSGTQAAGGKHVEIWKSPLRQHSHELKQHAECKGDVAIWFRNFISIQGNPLSGLKCWREEEGVLFCSGVRDDIRGLVFSLPVMLILDIEDSSSPPVWNFPGTLTPLTKTLAKKEGLIYDLVGMGLFSQDKTHFITRYASKSRSDIYTYDGMKSGGHTLRMEKGKFANHISGDTQGFPDGYSITAAVYHLRGGPQAQRAFLDVRRKEFSKRYDLVVSGEDLSTLPSVTYSGDLLELDPQDRFWLRFPFSSKKTEYVTTKMDPPPKLPNAPAVAPIPTEHHANPSRQATPSPESEETTYPPAQTQLPPVPAPVNSESPVSEGQSLPDSLFRINCRCGMTGDGNVLYQEEEGLAMQCEECRDWSHIACQRNGRASLLGPKDRFICDFCDGSSVLGPALDPGFHKKQRISVRK